MTLTIITVLLKLIIMLIMALHFLGFGFFWGLLARPLNSNILGRILRGGHELYYPQNLPYCLKMNLILSIWPIM